MTGGFAVGVHAAGIVDADGIVPIASVAWGVVEASGLSSPEHAVISTREIARAAV